MDNMHRIEKYTAKNTICIRRKYISNNESLDFFKVFLTNELINQKVLKTNNAIKKLLLLYLP